MYFHEPHKGTIYHNLDNPAPSASQGSRLTAATTKKKQSNKPYHQVIATAAAQNKSKLQHVALKRKKTATRVKIAGDRIKNRRNHKKPPPNKQLQLKLRKQKQMPVYAIIVAGTKEKQQQILSHPARSTETHTVHLVLISPH